MAYDISVPDVDGYWTGYENYHTSMNDALDEVKRALSDLMLLESFQGAAAASTKLYFQEVHLPIITGLITLAKYVGTDLSGFVQGFSAAPVNENKDARLPNDALARARGKLQDTFAAGDLNEIDGLLTKASNLMNSVITVGKPSVAPAQQALNARGDKIEKVRLAVQGLEDDCVAQLNSVDGFDSLVASLGAAISHYAGDTFDVGGYQAGSFSSSAVGQVLVADIGRAVEYQDSKREQVLAASEGVHKREHERLVEEQEKLQEQRTWARVIGLAAVTVGMVATIATLGTAGPVALAIASVGLVGSMADIKGRVDELTGGDEASDWETASKVYESEGKVLKCTDAAAEVFLGDPGKGIEDVGDIVGKWGVGKGTEALYEGMGYEEDDAEYAGKVAKTGYEAMMMDGMDELVEKATKNGAKNATRTARVSQVGNIVNIGSDIVADTADYAEDKLNEQIEGVERDIDQNARDHVAFAGLW